MTIFLYEFFIPVSAAITILLLFSAIRAYKKNSDVQSEEIMNTISYTNESIINTHSDIKEINSKIDENLMPKIESLYNQMQTNLTKVEGHHIISMLKDKLNIESFPITEDKKIILFGETVNDIKTTNIFRILHGGNHLLISVFSYYIENPPEELLIDFLSFNLNRVTGRICLHPFKTGFVIFIEHGLYFENQLCQDDVILQTYIHLRESNSDINFLLDKYGLKKIEFLAGQYINLLKASVDE